MAKDLTGKRVAIVVANGFEQVEMTSPREALEEAGAETYLVSIEDRRVKGWKHTDWGETYDVDVPIDEADPEDYDALVLPGGVMNPDKLRMDERVLEFVGGFFEEGKPVAAICHAPWTLIDTGVVEGRHVTSYPSLRADLENAGAKWTDQEVVVDQGLVTSRRPEDLPAFNAKMLEEIAEGAHAGARSGGRAS